MTENKDFDEEELKRMMKEIDEYAKEHFKKEIQAEVRNAKKTIAYCKEKGLNPEHFISGWILELIEEEEVKNAKKPKKEE